MFLRLLFFLLRFLFFVDESDEDLFDDKSDDDGSGSRLSRTFPLSLSENSVGHVSGLFLFSQVIGIFSFSRVIGIFPFSRINGIFSSCQVKSCQVKFCRVS